MKVSLNWVKEYLDFELPPVDELAERIGAQLGAVEEVEDLGAKYNGVVIVRVVECDPLENSDHLHRCLVDDGGKVQGVERQANGLVQVLTGAPNVHKDMWAVWLAPGVTVPESAGKEPFVLESRNMRGSVSHGMLASPRELALGDGHEGLLELDGDSIKPGDDFAEAYKLNDYIIDIENKMFTHRPDCFGILGVAREIAGILGHQFTSPDWYINGLQDMLQADGTSLPLEVHNELPTLVPRFVAIPLSNIEVKPSPFWLQSYLLRCGVRPISNVVDVTNYIMLLTGQPMHAYDYDKVKAVSGGDTATVVVRYPHSGEKITLLNGKEIQPREEAIMIATDKALLGVGGIMGGGATEVGAGTKNIILEVATFDMYSVRRTSMTHGLFTDAVTRFNKGQSPLQNVEVAGRAVQLLSELASASVAGSLIDNNHVGEQSRERRWVHPPVPVTTDFINSRLGLQLTAADIQKLLGDVECSVTADDDRLLVQAPFWRTDIETREDVVEEAGRLYGFDKLPLELPKRSIKPAAKDTTLELKNRLRTRLAKAGANEILTYSFVHSDLIKRVGQNPENAFQVSNALSPDLQYYRLSLMPSLLDKVHLNIKAGYDAFALFELGKTHFVGEMDAQDPELPNEDNQVALVVAYGDKRQPVGAAYYQACKYLEGLIDPHSLELTSLADFDLTKDAWGKELTAPYEPSRSAVIVKDGQIWGVVGEFKASVRRALKLPVYAAGFELHLDAINFSTAARYLPLPRFPTVWQDLTLKVTAEKSYAEVRGFVHRALEANAPHDTLIRLDDVGIYQAKGDQAHKNITFRVRITGQNRTLTDKEVSRVVEAIAGAAQKDLAAEWA